MKWITDFLKSSLGRKLIMSLTGLFLCLFLVVHMAGNLQLFAGDGGLTFNEYAYFMTHNTLIKTIAYGNYFFILLHAIQGIVITMHNRKAKGGKYQGSETANTDAKLAARNMRNLGLLILVFIGLHMYQFWGIMKFGSWPEGGEVMAGVAAYDENGYKNLYGLVAAAFSQLWVVAFYLISLVGLSLHLWHGFWSSFQTLGLANEKYSPILRIAALGFAIIVPLGFATMPIVFYAKSM